MTGIQAKLDYADAVADWFVDLSENHLAAGDLESALKCIHVAATILIRQNRRLSCPRIESGLRQVAARAFSTSDKRGARSEQTGPPAVCLHVLDEALAAGGLTAMAARWIENDGSGKTHSIALLSQQVPIPDSLRRVVTKSGGNIYEANPRDSFLHRAEWLRDLAGRLGGCVILHVGVADVVSPVAFGVPGGPPVILVNHAAHIFWTGASIADLVINCRGSALEEEWTKVHRGATKCAPVPIPLPDPEAGPRQATRERLGIPQESPVILTSGATFKYLPIDGLDFVASAERILTQVPDACLLAVGVRGDARWSEASARMSSRIKALGTVPHSELAAIQDAADVYIEGFPFGSTTALLEAGLKGLPVVLAPAQAPPPYASDGVALDGTLERPGTLGEYEAHIIDLCRNPRRRSLESDKIRRSVAGHHTGSGWRQYLEGVFAALPREHSVHPSITPVRTPKAINEYWSCFVTRIDSGYEETLELALTRALLIGLRPRVTRALRQACRQHRELRIRRTVPVPLLVFLCNVLFPLLPRRWAARIFRSVAFIRRGAWCSKLAGKIIRFCKRTKQRQGWYEEYRHARG